jgi:thiamine-phosphate pyrophosphorylase
MISGLYAVTPGREDTDALARDVQAALRGGARAVQYRNKGADPVLRVLQASRLAAICRRAGALLIVNDSVDLARESGADGVHLGRDDGDVASARRALGPGKCIGVSCYDDLRRARQAAQEGADYVAFGSFFPSTTKPGAVRAPLRLLRDASAGLDVPVVAIGGIEAANAGTLIEAGADAIAVISALFDAPDVERAARRLSSLFDQAAIQETIR